MHGSGGFQALLHTYSLTAAVLLGSIIVFLEAVCIEGVPPSLQTVGPLENGEVARPRLRKLCAVQENPYCGQNAQTQAARTPPLRAATGGDRQPLSGP
jgi:hypothetical protein